MKFARRTNWELSPNRVSVILENFKKNGEVVLDLTESNPTRCGIVYPQEQLLGELSKSANMFYTPSTKGLLSARQAVVNYYELKGIKISPEQIFLTASSSEAYSFLFRLLADPGETILFPAPSYPLFDFLVDLNDLKQGFYSLRYEKNWQIDFEEIHGSLVEQTKAIVTVNPNNPTGNFVKKDELDKLNDICSSIDAALISDEVFFDYAWRNNPDSVSLAGNTKNLTFTLGGLSKALGLPQMKLSWMIVNGPVEIVEDTMARLEVIADTYLSVNTPVQNALFSWLPLSSKIQSEILKRVAENRETLMRMFSDIPGISILHSEGGWYMILKLRDGIDEERLTENLLVKDRVYVHPGYFFNFNMESCVVLSLLPLPRIFSEGLTRIAARIK